MEFMPQSEEIAVTGSAPPVSTQVVEEEVAGIEICQQQNQPNFENQQPPPQLPPPPPPPSQENPIYFSDGVMFPSELNPASTSTGQLNEDQTVALPDNLLEIYDNLGLIGKLLTSGSIVTIRCIQAFRTLGESLVDILGITKPKYEYELNLAKQMQAYEAQRQQKLNSLYSGWVPPPPPGVDSPIPGPPFVASSTSIPMNTSVNMESSPVIPNSVQYPPEASPMVPPSGYSIPNVQLAPPQVVEMCPPVSLNYPPPPQPQGSLPVQPVPSVASSMEQQQSVPLQ